MERINTTNKDVDLFGAGKHGFKDGDPINGIFATFFAAAWCNAVQEELANVVEGGGFALDPNNRAQLLAAIARLSMGRSSVTGCDCKNNAATPNTQFDLGARQITMRDPATGRVVTVNNPAVKTVNILTAGPAAGGRDQAGAFAASSWVHFYWVGKADGTYDGIASASAENVGPALPATFTHWAYAGANYLDAGSALVSIRIKDNKAYYKTPFEVVTSGSALVETSFSLAARVPPNALSVQIEVAGEFNNNAIQAHDSVYIKTDSGIVLLSLDLSAPVAPWTARGRLLEWCPYVSSTMYYNWDNFYGNNLHDARVKVVAYEIPN